MSELNETIRPMEQAGDLRGNPADVSKIIVEEVSNALREELKEELKQDLRERARKGFFNQ